MILMLFAVAVAAPDAAVASANRSLADGDLAAAEASYRAVLAAGVTTGDVWFNLGNVLFRQQRYPEAVLAWRNAEARLPRDPDIQANLEFARRELRDGVVAPLPHPWFAPWQVALTVGEALWIGCALAGAGLLAVAARAWRPHVPFVPLGAAAIALGGLVVFGAVAARELPPVGVVLVASVTATSDLGGGVDLFTLHAGAEVQTEEAAAGHTLVVLPDGRKGWLPDATMGRVDPSRVLSVL